MARNYFFNEHFLPAFLNAHLYRIIIGWVIQKHTQHTVVTESGPSWAFGNKLAYSRSRMKQKETVSITQVFANCSRQHYWRAA